MQIMHISFASFYRMFAMVCITFLWLIAPHQQSRADHCNMQAEEQCPSAERRCGPTGPGLPDRPDHFCATERVVCINREKASCLRVEQEEAEAEAQRLMNEAANQATIDAANAAAEQARAEKARAEAERQLAEAELARLQAELAAQNTNTGGGSGGSGGGGSSTGLIIGGIAVAGLALYVFTGPEGVDAFNFSPDVDFSATENGYAYNFGGRWDYERDNLRLYWTAGQNANSDFRYSSGVEYDGGFWTAALTESVSDSESDFSAEIVWDLSAAAY